MIMLVLLMAYLVFGFMISIWVSNMVGRYTKSRGVRYSLFLLCCSLIFGEEIYTFVAWRTKCSFESGVYVYERVPVKGVFLEGPVSSGVAQPYLSDSYFGRENFYEFVEGEYSGQLNRYSYKDGGVFTEKLTSVDDLKSEYGISTRKIEGYPKSPWSITSSVYQLVSGRKIGEVVQFGYHGGAVVYFLRKLAGADKEGSVNYCGSRYNFPASVIPPITR